ncbi:MAG: SPFH domain-containing protein [Pseudomonadota bacterium]
MDWGFVGLIVLALIALLILASMRVRHIVHHGETGLHYRKETFVGQWEPGYHTIFDPLRQSSVHRISTLPSVLSPSQFEVISEDQFAFRITVAGLYTITDARKFHENHPYQEPMQSFAFGAETRMDRVNPVLSAGVAQAVAATALEDFLKDPKAAIANVSAQVQAVMPGAQLDDLMVTAITLPPEVRKMFTEVERARKEGLAALERAKGEQASLRALANAARTMSDNPDIAKLRMLQTMESAKGAKTFVLGKDESAG